MSSCNILTGIFWIPILIIFINLRNPGILGQTIPRFLEQPNDQTFSPNKVATLYCRAEGDPRPTIEWYQDDKIIDTTPVDPLSRRTVLPNGSLLISNASTLDEGVYLCHASNIYGHVRSIPATVKMNGHTRRRSVEGTEYGGHQGKMATTLGETAVLECRLNLKRIVSAGSKGGASHPLYYVGWKKDDKELRIFHDYYHGAVAGAGRQQHGTGLPPMLRGGPRGLLTGSGKDNRLTLTVTGNLMITRVKHSDTGYYVCFLWTDPATKTDEPGTDEEEEEGGDIGYPPNSRTRHHHQRQHKSASTTTSDTNIYTAEPISLIVHVKPNFMKVPNDVTAIAGEDIEFECLVRGKPDPTVIWKRKGRPIPGDRSVMTDQKSLRIQRVDLADEGTYVCEARNIAGSVQASATLTVHSRPTFIVTPRDQRVPLNGIASFDCVTSGNPAPAVYWTREGSQVLMFPDQPHGRFSVSTDGELRITGVQREDQGYYVCSALSVAGSSIAKAYLEIVPGPNSLLLLHRGGQGSNGNGMLDSKAHQPPPIIARGPSNQTLALNSVAFLPCSAQTDGTVKTAPVAAPNSGGADRGPNKDLKVTWFKDETVVGPDTFPPRFKLYPDGNLQIQDLQKSDTGIYTCVVSLTTQGINSKGIILSTSWSAALVVESPANPEVVFHRIPEVFTLPGPPGRPNIAGPGITEATNATTDTTLELKWRSTSEHDHGGSRIIGYMIEYYTPMSPENGWVVAARRVLEPRYVIGNLRPGTPYVFVVRAENSYGLGPPGPASEPIYTTGQSVDLSRSGAGLSGKFGDSEGSQLVGIQEEVTASLYDLAEVQDKLGAPEVVILTDARALTSTTIRLEWQVQKNLNYIQGFYLKYRPTHSPRSSPYHTVTLMDNLITYHLVTDLRKYIKYDFMVSPFFDAVEGTPSQILLAQTLEDVPSSPPEEVYAKVLTSTTLLITWYAPPETGWNGRILGYKVYCADTKKGTNEEEDQAPAQDWDSLLRTTVVADGSVSEVERRLYSTSPDDGISFDTNVSTTSFVISNLTSETIYGLRVAAFTSVGTGPYSEPLYAFMRPGQIGLSTYGSDLIISHPGNTSPKSVLSFFRKPWIIASLVAVLWICLLTFGFWFYRRFRNNHKNHNKDILDDAYSYQKGTLKNSNNLAPRGKLNLNAQDILWVDNKGWQVRQAGTEQPSGALATCCIVDNPITQHIENVLKGANNVQHSTHTLTKGINPAYKDESYSSKNRLINPMAGTAGDYHYYGKFSHLNNDPASVFGPASRSRCSTINRNQLLRRDIPSAPLSNDDCRLIDHYNMDGTLAGPIYETPHLLPLMGDSGYGGPYNPNEHFGYDASTNRPAGMFVHANSHAIYAHNNGADVSNVMNAHVESGEKNIDRILINPEAMRSVSHMHHTQDPSMPGPQKQHALSGPGLYATSTLLEQQQQQQQLQGGMVGSGNTMVDEMGRIYRVEQIGLSNMVSHNQNGCSNAYLYPFSPPLIYYNNAQEFSTMVPDTDKDHHHFSNAHSMTTRYDGQGLETLPKQTLNHHQPQGQLDPGVAFSGGRRSDSTSNNSNMMMNVAEHCSHLNQRAISRNSLKSPLNPTVRSNAEAMEADSGRRKRQSTHVPKSVNPGDGSVCTVGVEGSNGLTDVTSLDKKGTSCAKKKNKKKQQPSITVVELDRGGQDGRQNFDSSSDTSALTHGGNMTPKLVKNQSDKSGIFPQRVLNICEVIPPPPETTLDQMQNDQSWQNAIQYSQGDTPLITNNSESTNYSQSPDVQGSLKDLLMPSPFMSHSSNRHNISTPR